MRAFVLTEEQYFAGCPMKDKIGPHKKVVRVLEVNSPVYDKMLGKKFMRKTFRVFAV